MILPSISITHFVCNAILGTSHVVNLERQHQKVAEEIVFLLKSTDYSEIDVDHEDVLEFCDDPSDPDYDPNMEDQEASDGGKAKLVRFGDQLIEPERVQEAVDFWSSTTGKSSNGGKKRRSLGTMNHRFPFIKKESHLAQLRVYEREGKVGVDRRNAMIFISKELSIRVKEELKKCNILHDRDLRIMALKIQKENGLNFDFKFSDSWILAWKRGHGIRSRRITKFVARRNLVNQDEIQKKSDDFVASAIIKMASYSKSDVFNMDQSGFQYEMFTKRTLAQKGCKKVFGCANSTSATTHSYTILPLVSAAGKLHKTVFVVLQESKGVFPAKGHFMAPNLVVRAGKSHIMTKQHMIQFFNEVVFSSTMPDKLLLIGDAWPCWKDSSAIDSVKPANKSYEMMLIPPGCTGMIQPLDAIFYRACTFSYGLLDIAWITVQAFAEEPKEPMMMYTDGSICTVNDMSYGWDDEDDIDADGKKKLFFNFVNRLHAAVCGPLRRMKMTHVEYAALKALCIWKLGYCEYTQKIRSVGKEHEEGVLIGLRNYYEDYYSEDEMCERQGNLILLMGTIFEMNQLIMETYKSAELFALFKIDTLSKELLSL
ncbi:unnamed protein product [Caenorhabditis angaria]|uniref:NR LBD domain-containing protein n=1 Tax=Caenorhabditis angaria TaxID=860376 RepID=A0A9P1INX2_9PELO|nr:unnamed protein product [Caenorhabditis angaria]